MKKFHLLLVTPVLFGVMLVRGQTPVQIVSAAKIGLSDTIRVTFNVPVTPAGTTPLLAEDFSGDSIDSARWRVNHASFEPGGTTTQDSSATQAEGVLTIDMEANSPGWAGLSLATVDSFSASLAKPLVFDVDRVSHEEDASGSRTGIWITDSSRSHYVFFAENEGGGGWQYNRQIGATGDNPIGSGAITALVNGDDFNDLDTHHLSALLDGTSVRLYLDSLFVTEIPFPFSSGIVFEIGAYAADAGDLVTGVFDNARVTALEPVSLSDFAIENGAAVTVVSLTADPKVLELTTTGIVVGSEYTLSMSGIEGADGTLIEPNSTVPIKTGPVNSIYATEVLADGPVAYYQMDQIQGTTVPNLGLLETPAVYLSGPRSLKTQGPGLPDFPGFDAGNTAALFDGIGTYTDLDDIVQLAGVGNYIDTASPLLADLATFSIEAWIKPANLDEIRLGILGTFCTEFGFASPGIIHIFTCDGGVIYASYPFPYHEWHHIAVTGDGTNLTIYADGNVLAQVNDETDTYGGEDRNVYIGGGGIFDDVAFEGFGNWFPGGIDEVAIYTNALSAERIKSHFDAAFAAELHPTITITSPLENATIAPAAEVPITVLAAGAAGRTVGKVEFYDRFTKLGESTTIPYSFTIPSISEGRHSLTAKAYDDLGVSTISPAVRFVVGTPMPLLVMVVASVAQITDSDLEVKARLVEAGFDVQFVPANVLVPADVNEASLVVVPVVRVDSVAETLRELSVPIVTWDQDLEPTFLFTEDEVDVAWGDTGPELYIELVEPDHPLAAGLPAGIIPVNEFPQELAWGVPTDEAIRIAALANDPTRWTIYAYDSGATLVDGSHAPEKRVFFMLTDDTFLTLTEDGLKLFDAAIAWARREVEVPPRFNSPTVQDDILSLSWTGDGVLQTATNLIGDQWIDVPEAASRYSLPTGDRPNQFFRIIKR